MDAPEGPGSARPDAHPASTPNKPISSKPPEQRRKNEAIMTEYTPTNNILCFLFLLCSCTYFFSTKNVEKWSYAQALWIKFAKTQSRNSGVFPAKWRACRKKIGRHIANHRKSYNISAINLQKYPGKTELPLDYSARKN
ncbi:MAG: hypothetical protein ACLFQ6_00830 [Candidatus Sumerlaeia bacterium]